MIDLEEIRGMIRRRRVPANSRVLYGSAFWAFRNIWARIALIPFITGSVGIMSAIFTMSDVPPSSFDSIVAHFIAYAVLAALLLGCVITPLLIALMARKAALVFFPDVCIAFDNIRSSNPSRWKEFSYASISDVQLKLSFWLGPHLLVRNQDGREWRWYVVCYGPQGKTLQDILVAYNTYIVANKKPSMMLPYLSAHAK